MSGQEVDQILKKNQRRFAGVSSDCHSCVLDQALSAARFAALDEAQTESVLELARSELERSRTVPLQVQHILRSVADAVLRARQKDSHFDIYAAVKEKSNRLSLEHAKHFEEMILGSELPIETALQIAAAGNVIDFGAKNHGNLDVEQELERLCETPFAHFAIGPFKGALQKAKTLLYLCDNAGEIVFDGLFIQTLLRTYPDLEIVAATRERPIINDATLDDARAVGLDRLVEIISSGSVYPGTILSEASEEFQRLFAVADVILAKGQGNFETLLPEKDPRLFSLLRIKCDYMAWLSGIEKNSLVLMQGGSL
jgi:uncharacterized protein with ATP-grasp and redox domains